MNTMQTIQIRDIAWHTWSGCRQALWEARESSGLTLEEVAHRAGLHVDSVIRNLTGRLRLTIESFIAICEALSLDPIAVLFKARTEAMAMEPVTAA